MSHQLPVSEESFTASSTASNPNSVVNLITGFNATEDVSLNGSPTVSPITCRIVQCVPFCFHFDFHDLLALSQAPCVGHKDRLIQAEDRDRDQVPDKEERLHEGERQRAEEDRQEDIEHPLLRVWVQIPPPLAACDRGLLHASNLMFALMNSTAR